MRPEAVPAILLAGALVLATACASGRRPERDEQYQRGAVVLSGEALEDGSGSVLGAMTGKVPSMRVQHVNGHCPEITLRSHVSYVGIANPHVYVDGTRAIDTCVLESLRTNDVQRVEVYPQGYTTRPGYGTHSAGLILVFMRSG